MPAPTTSTVRPARAAPSGTSRLPSSNRPGERPAPVSTDAPRAVPSAQVHRSRRHLQPARRRLSRINPRGPARPAPGRRRRRCAARPPRGGWRPGAGGRPDGTDEPSPAPRRRHTRQRPGPPAPQHQELDTGRARAGVDEPRQEGHQEECRPGVEQVDDQACRKDWAPVGARLADVGSGGDRDRHRPGISQLPDGQQGEIAGAHVAKQRQRHRGGRQHRAEARRRHRHVQHESDLEPEDRHQPGGPAGLEGAAHDVEQGGTGQGHDSEQAPKKTPPVAPSMGAPPVSRVPGTSQGDE